MNNNQMPYGYGNFNKGCHCMEEINDLQRRINHLENRINRLENAVFSNNFNNYGNPNFLNSDNRDYTSGNYML